MGQVLYRKYRSKSLDDVIGQSHITDTLKNAIAKNLIGHAYLFTGPRGVGKTSIARILAYKLNDIEYDETQTYVDIIEIDAASNRRIDEIRELRDKINIVPNTLKYKVYIIDEVHMLTREAFNALLKTLEEPPEHAIFILATTELHKVPETIVSRCQRFSFKPIDQKTASKRLSEIAKKEDIKIDAESLNLIAEYSSGSFRDALSILDQLSSLSDTITESETRNVLGVASHTVVTELLAHMRTGNMIAIINAYRHAINDGNDPVILAGQIAKEIRMQLNKSSTAQTDLQVLKQLLLISGSRHPETALEIALLTYINNQPDDSEPNPHHSSTKPETNTPKTQQPLETITHQKKHIKNTVDTESADSQHTSAHIPTTSSSILQDSDWDRILQNVKTKRNTLYGILRMARAEIDAGDLTLHFAFPFHVKRASDAAHKSFLESTIKELGISYGKINMVHTKDLVSELPEPESRLPEPDDQPVHVVPQDVLNVFKGAEVLES